MPFSLLKRLNLPRQQRLLLFAIFGLGFFTVAISVLRISTSAWGIGELCSGITCACLPTLRPLLKGHFPALGTRLTGADDEYGHGLGETTATAATVAAHNRTGSGNSSQPSVDEWEDGSGSRAVGPCMCRLLSGVDLQRILSDCRPRGIG